MIAYPNLLGKKGYVVVVVGLANMNELLPGIPNRRVGTPKLL